MNPPPPVPLPRDFSDWHSPMVVKELRHGLRTRFFTLALMFFHVVLALLMSSALLGANQEILNGVFWFLALVVVLGAMPLRGFAALSSETADGTLDMLTLTNMSALRVVYGKWAALFSQTLLVASSLLPYMVARYHFGGVEILREFAALVVMVLGSALTTAALVAFSSQRSLLLRLLLVAGVFMAAMPLVLLVISFTTEVMGDSLANEFAALFWLERVGLVAGAFTLAGYGVWVFLTLGASRFAPPSENHSTVKRLAGLGVMGLFAVTGIGLGLFHADPDAAYWAFGPALVLTLLLGMDVMTETMPRFPTVVAGFTRGGRWLRLAGRFLYPGWASGVPYYLVLCLAPLSIVAAIQWHDYDLSDVLLTLCLLTANVVPLSSPYFRQQRFAGWWVIQLALITAGTLMMILGDAMDVDELGGLGILTPSTALFGAEMNWSHSEPILLGGAIFGGLWVLAALFLAKREMLVYAGLEAEALASLVTELPAPADEPAS